MKDKKWSENDNVPDNINFDPVPTTPITLAVSKFSNYTDYAINDESPPMKMVLSVL